MATFVYKPCFLPVNCSKSNFKAYAQNQNFNDINKLNEIESEI